MSDFDKLLEELEHALSGLFGSDTDRRGGSAAEAYVGRSLFSATGSLRIRNLDEILPRRGVEASEPLVDVIEEAKTIRVLVALPGVKRRDVRVSASGKALKVEVKRDKTTYVKEVSCNQLPTRISVDSAAENNSVVEIIFKRIAE